MIAKRILQLLFFLFIISCATKKLDSEEKNIEVKAYNNALQHIIDDASFKGALKKSYSDLGGCEKIVFVPASYTKSLSINFFQKEELINTSYFSKFSRLNYLDFDKEKKEYDSISKTNSSLIGFNEFKKDDSTNNCRISLTFSKVVKNLLVVEYKVIDENVDPRILYTPRKGYYLIEFNNNQSVTKGIYKILNW
ncbi:conserved hypothetical protein [Tenacibaculum maritimum]|uniref:hypothetical protein n=1 Tax=Tenacibaculum maritimum TaxID=107401 RepID=UPI0012E4D0C8|nr:hypothetical protein [Tenacibaculum maritimum]CAA0155824.1 conserved hypothetical protein [Tenacibaculum maritimum]CAA0233519.1 conserved hypothetical protein [Tenacibaculum maritimum]CAA0235729.1 conserved hypothetical protein [Tenacibaculum maritimum]